MNMPENIPESSARLSRPRALAPLRRRRHLAGKAIGRRGIHERGVDVAFALARFGAC